MNKFKRILLASGLAATASLMANSPAFAGTTGKIDLSGTVSSTLTITVAPTTNATSLDLTPNTTKYDVKIGNITNASSNSPNGLRVVASSTSNWKLISGQNAIDIIFFGDSQGTTSTAPGNMVSTSPEGTFTLNYTNTTAAGSAQDSGIFISYIVPADAATGTYTGSITFTAFDN